MNYNDCISIFSAILQAIMLIIQAIIMHKVGKMSEKSTIESMERTEIINKNQRFATYDRDLNLILLEFWNCYKEIEGFNNKLEDFNKNIRSVSPNHKKVAIENMRDFFEKFKLPIQFNQMRANEYVFLINENMENTIWKDIWSSCKLHELQINMYDFIKETNDLSKNQRQALDLLNNSFFKRENEIYICKDDENLYENNNNKLIDLQNHINEMKENIKNINNCVSKFKEQVPTKSNFSEIIMKRE